MTSLLRRKHPITPSNTATAKALSAPALLAGLAITLLIAAPQQGYAAEAAKSTSVLKIRSANSSPTTSKSRPARSTKLKALAHAPRLEPTPAPPEPMFEDEVDQVDYEQYELIAQNEVEPTTPLLNSNRGKLNEKDCTIKNQRSIHELTDSTQAAGSWFPRECPSPHTKAFEPRSWEETTFMWKASALCHKPLYFEDVQLERYGHSWGPVVQPVISSGMFFATVPIIPYKMGVEAPWECVYPLGHYRPGDCAPYMIPPVPVSVRGATAQAAAVAGGVLLVP